jgi:hypothetical protein
MINKAFALKRKRFVSVLSKNDSAEVYEDLWLNMNNLEQIGREYKNKGIVEFLTRDNQTTHKYLYDKKNHKVIYELDAETKMQEKLFFSEINVMILTIYNGKKKWEATYLRVHE